MFQEGHGSQMFPLLIGVAVVAVIFALSQKRTEAEATTSTKPSLPVQDKPGLFPADFPENCKVLLSALPAATKTQINAVIAANDESGMDSIAIDLAASNNIAEADCLRRLYLG